ncbi:MAG TPA: hypothetical protein VJY62_02080 [Bacteroidia bacterium]|nr:hypothetical protein [Bacteroidia bacterium]
MVKSKFTVKAYSVLLILFILFLMVGGCVQWMDAASESMYITISILLLLLLLYFIYVLITTELKTKMVKVVINIDHISAVRYAGLFQKEQLYFKELEGYFIKQVESESSSSEFCYLIKDGKTVIILSDYYHKNYRELKAEIQSRIKPVKMFR